MGIYGLPSSPFFCEASLFYEFISRALAVSSTRSFAWIQIDFLRPGFRFPSTSLSERCFRGSALLLSDLRCSTHTFGAMWRRYVAPFCEDCLSLPEPPLWSICPCQGSNYPGSLFWVRTSRWQNTLPDRLFLPFAACGCGASGPGLPLVDHA